ncbi:alpha/beta hydrolase [Actinomadura sediminis]|uniref:Alpha/beta hydrolase n=1 Tax=Actinomadura sediminis TaxID=1038904 RepID=A0ABW3EGL8_9ACTN
MRAIDLRVPVATPDGTPSGWQIAATVYLPAQASTTAAPVLVLLPGGGYNRRYFDLPVPGFSQARHHAEQGTVVVALDYLGVGDSSVPPFEATDLPTVAATGHAATIEIVDRLRRGSLAPEAGPLAVRGIVGAGQSLGGHVVAGMQAYHRTFDAVAFLGSSMAGTVMPARAGAESAAPYEDARASLDAAWVFHWEAVTEADAADSPHDLASLVAADIAGGLPRRTAPPPWGTGTYPGCSTLGLRPEGLAVEIASVNVPVLLATGERDVCHPPAVEVATLKAATDISIFVVPRSAHMHNFSLNRHLLWGRLDAFVSRTTEGRAGHARSAAT